MNRYLFFKGLYKEYVILFKNNKIYGIDKYLKKYLKNKDLNYLIIDNDNNIEIYKYKVNNYKYYLIRLFLIKIISK